MITIHTKVAAALIAVMWMLAGPVMAGEVTSQVVAVRPDGEVQLRLPPGSPVAPGDDVRIEAEVPGVGMLAIQTRWQVVRIDRDQLLIVARPQGAVTGTPQVGYSAIITTANDIAPQSDPPSDPQSGPPSDPNVTPYEWLTYETLPCDISGGSPDDPDLAGIAPGVDYADIDADRVIRDCLAAVQEWPDTPRFYTNLTRGYFKAGRMEDAYRAAVTGMEKGSAQSTAYLAILYLKGSYVQKDIARALALFEQSAQGGNPGGMIYAAGMYFHGEGTEPNPTAAAFYYQMAADLGVGDAYANLAYLYDFGLGVPRNPEESARFYMMALAMDNDLARNTLLAEFGTLTLETRIEIQMILSGEGNYSGMVDGADDPATYRALLAHIRKFNGD
ncbi:MAG: hypothetical protein COC12_02600 [Rhodobacteraceae bacterium]|nr:MAG: hypothetical protein COC12_02600 [Paracoccaceae bacterium]